MAHCRSVLVFGLLLVWTAMPALACLPNSQMTNAEMACCKKMAGDCHMGNVQHPCCKTVSNAPTPVASIQLISQVHPVFAVIGEIAIVDVAVLSKQESEQVRFGLPPPAPPGLNPILRI
jgi:hypothetical protein